MKHLDSLNPVQKEAVLYKDGPILILAGAGAGKTKTITHRILHLIKEGIAPHNILAITFTNKAAKEMRDRVFSLIKNDAEINLPVSFNEKPMVTTFHSLGVHIIRENSRFLGLQRHFTIFDKSDSNRAMKEAIIEEGLDPKRFEPAKIQSVISREKGNMMTVEKYRDMGRNDYFSKIIVSLWGKYEAILKREQALDFDDLILKTAILLSENPEVLKHYQETWKYINIDEYQDTNRVQYTISKLLCQKSKNICVVGDGDQNIYSWRGADMRNILDFEKDYPNAKVILLEENYRSTQTILDSANTIIKKNKRRKEKNLFTKNEVGEKIALFEGYDEVEEANFIARKAKELHQSGVSLNEIAVLYRANFQSRVLEEAFLSHQVPYQLLGTKFFERKEIKDALSYIRAAINPSGLSDIKRIINTPPRGIGKVTILKIFAGNESGLPENTQKKVAEFKELLQKIKEVAEKDKASELIKFIIAKSGMESAYKNGTEEDIERLENLQELVTLATKYDYFQTEGKAQEGLEKLLEEAALQSDQDELKENKDGVKLMTVHSSKGLEFEYVFITGLEEDLFPHRRISEEEISQEEAEEERRLFYVALTRAKKKLFLTFTGIRTIFGSKHINVPSEFLSDIDDKNIEHVLAKGEISQEIDGEINTERPDREAKREKIIYFEDF
jgi:DNA helicase-2/ATP-dependent DNA helicase PcrA